MTHARLLVFALIGSYWFGEARCHAKEYQVYFLGGQSNMDGYGQIADLDQELRETSPEVMIFHGNTSPDGAPVDGKGAWAPLQPGHGVGFSSDGKENKYSDRFGVELTFARQLQRLRPNVPIALIKYSRGGTSIDQAAAGGFGCWEPDFEGGEGAGRGVNQYDHFLATIRHAMTERDIDGDGQDDQLVPAGILWMQGESDAAASVEIAERYADNLKRLIDLIRAALRADDLPVAIGRISDSGRHESGRVWQHGPIVRAAQAEFVAGDGAAALVDATDQYGYSDPWHYDSAGYIDLGRRFAEALSELGPHEQ
ncbi:MAG: sialate O-acetylesterase [Planctomycetota bacterium]